MSQKFTLECAGSFSSSNATEADIDRAFDDDGIRGEYLILTAPNGDFIQAAGEGDGPYTVEHRVAMTGMHYQASESFTKDEARRVLLAFRRRDADWPAAHQWTPIERRGCLAALLLPGVALWAVCTGH